MRRLAGPFVAALERTRQPMVVTDPRLPDNPIIFANPAFLALTGYGADEILGRNCRFLQGPDTDPDAVALVREAIAGRREIKITLLNYRKDGGSFWNELYLGPVFDEAGDLVNFFASQVDVTHARRGEAAQERLVSIERRLADAQG
ncbi:PAS domain-containing protein [Methylobacterium sp. E-065]|uniref:PAS domain-containing protein n=1 Tax=Methylobacterium sp. E-065 TaxID=2836583 RepID=UPI0028BEE988|nr:PAS domain-containing protein [Methylobacterium sp. E-065]